MVIIVLEHVICMYCLVITLRYVVNSKRRDKKRICTFMFKVPFLSIRKEGIGIFSIELKSFSKIRPTHGTRRKSSIFRINIP